MEDDERPSSRSAADPAAEISLDVIPLHSTNLVTVLDGTGTIRYESPSIERILGYDPEALVGEPLTAYLHPDDRERVLEAFQTVVTSEEYIVEAVEYRHAHADGSYRWVESVGAANPTPEGHYVINTRDISDRRGREQALEHSNERLDEFASVVSHDLRNPLNVAEGRLALARESCDCDHLDDVARALDRMETLIDDLLTFAQSGTRVQELEPVDIDTLGEACWRTIATDEASLEVTVNRPVRADRSRLQQLLENLLWNAVEHGGETVAVTIGELPDATGFYVADDGPGVPEDRREQVFERGYSTRADGTGFGLAIVAEIAAAHGWKIELVESEAGGARYELSGVTFE